MKLEELYKDIIGVVCDVTGLVEADILASNREECADARYLLVMALSKMLTDHEIGRFINRTRQGVSFIRSIKGSICVSQERGEEFSCKAKGRDR